MRPAAGYRLSQGDASWPAGKAKLVGIDLLATEPVAGAQIFEGDITDNEIALI